MSHCETPARAPHRKDTSGKAGDGWLLLGSWTRSLFEVGDVVNTFLFFRGRWDEGVEGFAIVRCELDDVSIRFHGLFC